MLGCNCGNLRAAYCFQWVHSLWSESSER